MSSKNGVIGAIITVVIGGAAYTINQTDLVNNFAADSGLSQEQAQDYIDNMSDEDFASFTEIGGDFLDDGEIINGIVADMDCATDEYEWESPTLTCEEGKNQLERIANDSIALGDAYIKLDDESASEADIRNTISLISVVNNDYDLEIVGYFLDFDVIDETKKSGSYNKALLEAALDSE
ncbi:MAG: hypothetical protein R3B71_04790 [Candidatus Gracilibacteria bacterium]